MAALAFDERIGAMQLDEPLRARAGEAMQAIDVLRDDGAELAGSLKPNDGVMHGVWLRIAERVAAFKLVIPVLDPRRFRGHEVLVIDRLTSLPDALRPAKIRDTTAGGDPGPGKDEGAL